jgi:hypothetical protein
MHHDERTAKPHTNVTPTKKSASYTAAISILAIINATLYFTVSIEGGRNIEKLFNISEVNGESVVYPISAASCLVYTMFMY